MQIIIIESSLTEQRGIVAINSSDTLAVGVTDAYSQLRALLNTDDVLTLAWQESAAILARLDRSETVPSARRMLDKLPWR